MAQITIDINGRNYRVQSAEGQEDRILELGRYVDARVRDLVRTGGNAPDQQLLVMLALILADEVWEATTELDSAAQRLEDLTARLTGGMAEVVASGE